MKCIYMSFFCRKSACFFGESFDQNRVFLFFGSARKINLVDLKILLIFCAPLLLEKTPRYAPVSIVFSFLWNCAKRSKIMIKENVIGSVKLKNISTVGRIEPKKQPTWKLTTWNKKCLFRIWSKHGYLSFQRLYNMCHLFTKTALFLLTGKD